MTSSFLFPISFSIFPPPGTSAFLILLAHDPIQGYFWGAMEALSKTVREPWPHPQATPSPSLGKNRDILIGTKWLQRQGVGEVGNSYGCTQLMCVRIRGR